MAYLPEHGLGYAFAINAANGPAFGRISNLIRSFLVGDLPEPDLPVPVSVPDELVARYAGFYEPVSPRMAVAHSVSRLLGMVRLSVVGEILQLEPLLGSEAIEYLFVTDRLARSSEQSLTSLALLAVGGDTTYVDVEQVTYRKVPGWLAWGQIFLFLLVVVVLASSLLFALVWVPRRLFGGLRETRHIGIRGWPLLSTLALLGFAGVLVSGWSDLVRSGPTHGPCRSLLGRSDVAEHRLFGDRLLGSAVHCPGQEGTSESSRLVALSAGGGRLQLGRVVSLLLGTDRSALLELLRAGRTGGAASGRRRFS